MHLFPGASNLCGMFDQIIYLVLPRTDSLIEELVSCCLEKKLEIYVEDI